MKRRDFLAKVGATGLVLSAFPFGWTSASEGKPVKVLYFTRSAGFEHPVVRRKDGELSFSEKVLTELGQKHGFEVTCTKDGRVFDGDLDQYDVIAAFATGDLTKPNKRGTPPMSPKGKQRLLDAVADGKGFVGFHAATDSFHTGTSEPDPYIAMIGAEFKSHGKQQKATMRVVSPKFPGLEGAGERFELLDEWYTFYHFHPDLHVILVQETKGMKGPAYQRPPYPATWARKHGNGRVFYTSMGHREDVWTNPLFQQIILGGLSWAAGRVEADVTPNFKEVTPEATKLHY